MADRIQWYCSTLDVPGGRRVQGGPTVAETLGVAAADKVWQKGTRLRVRFLDGSPALHDRVLTAARDWLVPGVRLDIVQAGPDEPAEIRVDFQPKSGAWSYIGTDNLGILAGQPTMNLGWATLDTPAEDFSSVVLHEFGHALGLLHEHNHPKAKISWNRAAVVQDLAGPPNRWSERTIEDNVFAKFAASQVITTKFDEASVMIYTIPAEWTTDGSSFMPSPRLSAGDRATMLELYGD